VYGFTFIKVARNILYYDQSDYSSRIMLSDIPAKILSISCKWLG